MRVWTYAFAIAAVFFLGMWRGGIISDQAHEEAAMHTNVLVTKSVVYVHVLDADIISLGTAQCKQYGGLREFIEERRADGILVSFVAFCDSGKSVDLSQTVIMPHGFTRWQ